MDQLRELDPSLQWLVFGGAFSVGTSVLRFLWSRLSMSVHSCVFQFLCAHFELAEHRFCNVPNLVAVTRLLKLIGLDTHQYMWCHDANADTNDAMMVGLLRIPTRSWILWGCAMLSLTHYIWIKDDQEIAIIGPKALVETLLRLGNITASRQATTQEVASLRRAFGLDGSVPDRERGCVVFERLVACTITMVTAIFFFTGRSRKYLVLCAACGTACTIASELATATCARSILDLVSVVRAGRLSVLVTQRDNQAREAMEMFLQDERDPDQGAQPMDVDAPIDEEAPCAHTAPHIAHEESDARYSIVISVSNWYEMAVQLEIDRAVANEPDLCVTRRPVLYALPAEDALPRRIAPRVHREGNQLYICMHNPMTDCNLAEMRALITKAARDVALVVLLPLLGLWETELSRAPARRLHAHKETRYVATLADLHVWFVLMTSGMLSRLAFVLPYAPQDRVQSTKIWKIASSIMPCHVRCLPSAEKHHEC